MFGSELNKHRRYVGSIDPDCNVREILDDAYEDAKFLCEHYYSAAPEMKVRVHSGKFLNPISFSVFSTLKPISQWS